MNSESKPSSSTVAGERLDAARPLGAVALPDVRGQEHPEPADVSSCAASSCWCAASSAAVLGVALREEGARALEHVVGGEDPDRRLELGREAVVDVGLGRERRSGAWPRGRRAARARRSPRRWLVARATRLARRHDLVDEADPLRLVGVEHPAGQDQLLGPRQPRRPAAGAACRRRPASPPAAPPGRPSFARSDATRMSQHSASSSPPPSALPSIAAIVGIGSVGQAARRRRSRARAAPGRPAPRCASNSPTCEPAENARSPRAGHDDRPDVAGVGRLERRERRVELARAAPPSRG